MFTEFDEDKDGKIDCKEFSTFCKAEAARRGVLIEVPPNTETITGYLGPHEAAHGFQTAIHALDANPAAALVPMPESDWLPIHCVLMMGHVDADMTPAKKAVEHALMVNATPLLKKILEKSPESAAQRVMKGVRYPEGQLPIYLALLRGWDKDVVEALLKAHQTARFSSLEVLLPRRAPRDGCFLGARRGTALVRV